MPNLRDFLPSPPWEGPPIPKCIMCGTRITPEEALLSVIFGASPMCKECFQRQAERDICRKCGKPVSRPIYFEGRPYHSVCLPYAREE